MTMTCDLHCCKHLGMREKHEKKCLWENVYLRHVQTDGVVRIAYDFVISCF